MLKSLTSLSLAALVGLTAAAASATDFEIITAPVSTATYTSDADLETISGTSIQVSGTIATDLKDPSKTSGTITIPVTSLVSGVAMRDEHMAGKDWLNAAQFPNITFAIKSLKLKGDNKALTAGSSVQADATGEFTLHGVTKTITIPVRASYRELPAGQVYGLEGNLLRIESSFSIKLSDYGVNIPAPLTAKVANELTLTVKATAKQK
jgi:polyisoprenoid-binding protein YceI